MSLKKQCLQCGDFCTEVAILCQSCQSLLRKRFAQDAYKTEPLLSSSTKVLPETEMIRDGDSIDSGPLAARPLPWVRRRVTRRRMRRIFIAFVLLIIIVLIVDGVLVLLVFKRPSPVTRSDDALPLTVVRVPSRKKVPAQFGLSNAPSGKAASVGKTSHGTAVATRSAPQSRNALLSISIAQLAFTISQGQASAGAQHLTLTNPGGRALTWQASIGGTAPSWLVLAVTQGTLDAEKATSLTVDVSAATLLQGTYSAQIIVSALDSSGVAVSGSPQAVSVTLNVVPPCILQVTPTSLTFSASLLQPNPADQTINLSVTGNCSLPIAWQVDSGNSNWLVIAPFSSSENGTASSASVHVNSVGKLVGSFNGQIVFSAQDSTGAPVAVDVQVVSVTLNVLG